MPQVESPSPENGAPWDQASCATTWAKGAQHPSLSKGGFLEHLGNSVCLCVGTQPCDMGERIVHKHISWELARSVGSFLPMKLLQVILLF